jgi:uncharacterized protein (DUF433 family)
MSANLNQTILWRDNLSTRRLALEESAREWLDLVKLWEAENLNAGNAYIGRAASLSSYGQIMFDASARIVGTVSATSFTQYQPELAARLYNRALAERLCEAHPEISTDPGIFGGNPHIANVRLTVGNILGKLYNYGSVQAVAEMYAPHVNESQIKEAIAYAQDFLEEAIHAGEPS